MSKQNYITKSREYQELKETIRKYKQAIAKKIEKSGIMKRHRKIKNATVLVDAMSAMIIEQLSFRRLAEYMDAKYKVKMSDTAWEKQIIKCAEAFYKAVTEISAAERDDKVHTYLIDASNIPKEGRKGASMRLHCSYCLDQQDIEETIISDWHKAESICNYHLLRGSLYIADRAYGKTNQMAYVMNQKANFLFRLTPNHVRLYSDKECRTKLNFADILSNTNADLIVLPCYMKCNKKHFHIRVEASRIPEEKLAEIEHRQKRIAQKKQHKVSPSISLFSKWLILVTSLYDSSICLSDLYAKRWQIELFFKRAKSVFAFRKIRYGSDSYSLSLTHIWVAVVLFASLFATHSFLSPFDSFSLFASTFA